MKTLQPIWKRIVSLVLALVLCSAPVTALAAEDGPKEFTYGMVSSESYGLIEAKFALVDGEIYIEESSVCALADDINGGMLLGQDDYDYYFNYGKNDVNFKGSEVYVGEEGIYYPFAKVMGGLNLQTTILQDGIVAQPGPNMRELYASISDIHNSNTYNMAYWQNSPLWEFGEALDTVLSFELLSSVPYDILGAPADALKYNQYTTALWSILLPQEEEDIKYETLIAKFGETASYVSDGADLAEYFRDITDGAVGKIDHLGNLGEFSSTAGDWLTHGGRFLYLTNLLGKTNNMDDSLRHAMELLDQGVSRKKNRPVSDAIDAVISYHSKETPTWGKIALAGISVTIDVLQDELTPDLGPEELREVSEKAMLAELAASHGIVSSGLDKIDGTVKAVRLLELQKQSKNIFKDSYSLYHRTARLTNDLQGIEARNFFLEEMHSLSVFYLRAGIEAYRAMADASKDKELKQAAKDAIRRMNNELEFLSGYGEEDFNVVGRAQEVEKMLAEYAAGLSDIPEEPVVSGGIVHDWIMTDGRIRLSLKADGTFHYENDNNFHIDEGTYTYDSKNNVLTIPELDGEGYTGFINEFDELEVTSATAFFLLSREATNPAPPPIQANNLNGTWTQDETNSITFNGQSFTYYRDGTTILGTYEAFNDEGTIVIRFTPEEEGLEMPHGYINGQYASLWWFEGSTHFSFVPDDINDYPFVGVGSDIG